MIATSQFATINGLRLHYLDFGNSAKSPLISIHGLSGNAHNFDGLAPHLVSDYHVISLDVRGRGDSQWGPAEEYNQTCYNSDLATLIDQLGFRRVTLIGTSMGGMIATLYAGGYPERVERMVLNDVGPEVDPAGIKRITDYMSIAPAEFASLAEVGEYYRENYPAMRRMPEQELLAFVKWAVKATGNGALRWKMDPAIRNVPRSGSAARPLDMWVPYARITAPVLLIRGADSDILARATAERMRAVLPQLTTVVEVPGVGHAPSLLEPEALSAIKHSWRGRQDDPGDPEAGITTPNPTVVGAAHLLGGQDVVRGILRVTHNSFFWGVGLWALAHIISTGDLAGVLMFGSIGAWCFVGASLLDAKKAARHGLQWREFAEATSNLPFLAIAQRRQRLILAEIGWWRLVLAVTLFFAALYGHRWAFGVSPFPRL